MKPRFKFLRVLSALIVIFALICTVYMADQYSANDTALDALVSDNEVSVSVQENMAVFSPALPEVGFIFYPGGKVEYTAYAPLMRSLAEQNILCVLLKMPGNLAILNIDAAEEIPSQFPYITKWFIGGHSLGGSMAASYLSNQPEQFEGLALLAAYSTADLSNTDLKVLSAYGTQDGVLNLEKYEKYRSNLPRSLCEHPIEGGNHAYFGSYGLQDGDNPALISPEEQIDQTVELLLGFFAK